MELPADFLSLGKGGLSICKGSVCVLRETSISMCPTGDKYKYVSHGRSE